jgi:PAS domain S-box-containing protein
MPSNADAEGSPGSDPCSPQFRLPRLETGLSNEYLLFIDFGPESSPRGGSTIHRGPTMSVFGAIARSFTLPRFPDEDTDRNARIIYAVALTIFFGMCVLFVYRLVAGSTRLLPVMALMAGSLLVAVLLARRGRTTLAGSFLLWSLLAFLNFLAWTNDGLHDTTMFALPGLLVVAGLILHTTYFTLFTIATLASVCLIGVLEVSGHLSHPFSTGTSATDVVDVVVIIGLSALTVRLMTKNLLSSVLRARTSEREARDHAERSLLSETRFRLLFNSGSDAIMVHGFDDSGMPDRFVEVNDIACKRLGYSREELLRMTPLDIDDPETIPAVAAIMDRLRVEKYAVWEGIHLARDGRRIPVEISNRVFDLNGHPTIIATVRDITERKRTDEQLKASLHEKEVLLREIHHRVKNNMQVITSLLSLASGKVNDPSTRQHFVDSMHRIHSMALVHEKLYRSGNLATIDFGDYLATVTNQLMRSSGKPGITCSVDAEKISLAVDTAIPCGLIVNELVSNSLKHAFGGREQGMVTVRLRRNDPKTVELSVQDDGAGFPPGLDFRSVLSMGMNLVVSLTDQIGGTVDLQRDGGTTFLIRFPG